MQLNVFIARSGFTSRRKSSQLIKAGEVSVDGKVVKEPWYNLKGKEKVKVGNKLINAKIDIYIKFYKPRGVFTTRKDTLARKTFLEFLPSKYKGVFSVGRLDKNSQGLLLLTNDGKLCFKLTHPKFKVEKEYILKVAGKVTSKDLKKAYRGIKDEGEVLKIKRAFIDSSQDNQTILRVIVCEGKKRHLRRLFAQLGFRIIFLKRIRISSLHLGNLKPGEFKLLSSREIAGLLKQSCQKGA